MSRFGKITLIVASLVLCLVLFAFAGLAETQRKNVLTSYEKDSNGHTPVYVVYEYPVLEDGSLGSGHPVNPEETVKGEKEPHKFNSDGKCTVCGYVKKAPTPAPTVAPETTTKPEEVILKPSASPVASATPAPSATVAPEATATAAAEETENLSSREKQALAEESEGELTEVAETEEVRGVKVADNLTAVEAAEIIGEELEKSGAKVTIAVMDKVLKQSEKATYNALTPKERLMVVLSVLGLNKNVEEAATKDPSLLSKEALDLITAINERLTPEELEKLLGDEVVKGKVLYNGVEYDIISLDIVVEEKDGSIHHEIYTFRNENGEWILTKIEKN